MEKRSHFFFTKRRRNAIFPLHIQRKQAIFLRKMKFFIQKWQKSRGALPFGSAFFLSKTLQEFPKIAADPLYNKV